MADLESEMKYRARILLEEALESANTARLALDQCYQKMACVQGDAIVSHRIRTASEEVHELIRRLLRQRDTGNFTLEAHEREKFLSARGATP